MSISKKNPIYIMLVDNFKNNNLALASKNNIGEYRIYISNTEKIERAFHHEMYHILEYNMEENNSRIYRNWEYLNPYGFEYTEDTSLIDSKYVYNKNEEISLQDIYFLTRYSKATEREDRAEIFAEIMILKDRPNYLQNENIKNKINEIINTININLTEEEFYYNKYIK